MAYNGVRIGSLANPALAGGWHVVCDDDNQRLLLRIVNRGASIVVR
jgi:hypothetical protein